MKENINKAFKAAEQELEDKEVKHLKTIIQNLLQKKKDAEIEKNEIDDEIKLIKQEIEDFKSGRLDRIKERHEKNPQADHVCPIHITIINDNTRVTYPTQPWRWNYQVIWNNYYPPITNGSLGNGLILTGGSGVTNLAYSAQSALQTTASLTGVTSATYTSGTYQVNGNIINL